jgi:alanyl-tRNA synthetase
MTTKLYVEDQYRRNFSSRIVGRTQVEGNPGVILEQTVFYPTSGGQPHDTGTLNDIPVIDVFEDESRRVVHLLKEPVTGPEVEGRINWERRFDHMQQHTGQHLLSQAFIKVCNAETLSFHLGEESATLDLNQANFTPATITSVENLANQIIYENRKVMGHIVDRNELNHYPVRKPPAVEDNIRIIEIKDFDYSPCGGTHCSQTGEIGMIKIKRFENYKGGSRMHFVCGARALTDYQKKSDILRQIGNCLSSGAGDLPGNIQKIQEELKSLRSEQSHLKKRVLHYEADSLASERKKLGNFYIIAKIFEDRDPKELKILAQTVLENSPNTVTLFGVKSQAKASLLFLRSEDLPFDMEPLMQAACAVIDGHGGGRPEQAQGGGTDVENLEKALRCAVDLIAK